MYFVSQLTHLPFYTEGYLQYLLRIGHFLGPGTERKRKLSKGSKLIVKLMYMPLNLPDIYYSFMYACLHSLR